MKTTIKGAIQAAGRAWRWRRHGAVLSTVVLTLLAACGSTPVSPPPTPEPTPIVLPPLPSPTVVPTATARPTVKLRLQVANTGGDGANLRAEASTKAKVVVTLAEGAVVEEDGPEIKAENRDWRKIKDAKGNSGWVASEFLKVVP